MKSILLLLCLLFSAAGLSAQDGTAPEAVVALKRGEPYRGKLLGYRYGNRVSLLLPGGEVLQIPWRRIHSVTLRPPAYTGAPGPPPEATFIPPTLPPALVDLPTRRWRHGVTTSIGFASGPPPDPSSSFFTGQTDQIGMGLGYLFARQIKQVAVGVSPAYEVMSAARGEKLASLTGLVEYRLGKGRLQPIFRMRAGASLPIGTTEVEVTDRRISPVYHPSVGVQLAPIQGRWSALSLDVGYRFTYLETTSVNQNLEVVERKAAYRRLTFTLGTTF